MLLLDMMIEKSDMAGSLNACDHQKDDLSESKCLIEKTSRWQAALRCAAAANHLCAASGGCQQ